MHLVPAAGLAAEGAACGDGAIIVGLLDPPVFAFPGFRHRRRHRSIPTARVVSRFFDLPSVILPDGGTGTGREGGAAWIPTKARIAANREGRMKAGAPVPEPEKR